MKQGLIFLKQNVVLNQNTLGFNEENKNETGNKVLNQNALGFSKENEESIQIETRNVFFQSAKNQNRK